MTREDIIRMAEESGLAEVLSKYDGEYGHDNSKETAGFLELVRFASLVAAHEREECAKVCDRMAEEYAFEPFQPDPLDFSDEIRARGEQEQPR